MHLSCKVLNGEENVCPELASPLPTAEPILYSSISIISSGEAGACSSFSTAEFEFLLSLCGGFGSLGENRGVHYCQFGWCFC